MRRSRSISPALALALAFLVVPPSGAAPAAAQTAGPTRVRIQPAADAIVEIEGLYPRNPDVCPARQPRALRTKYRGTLDLEVASNGTIRIINTIDFEHYLRGLAEVPPSWPDAALRAQAIAARSYALDALRRGGSQAASRGYDICSTDACQVYRGATIELGAFGERWVSAVEATRRRVLTHRGRVVQAFYFSTSDGRTRRSFPGGTPQPYYPSVDAEDDDAPLARWTAQVPFSDLTRILRAAGSWRGGTITSVRTTGDGARIGDGTRTATLDRAALRRALNNHATCVFPDRYPGRGSQTGRKLPLTVPSVSYTVATSGSTLVLRGRGWGHGVGMSQWGARSLAERGWSAERILSHYYGPARVSTVPHPGTIRVLAAERLRTVRITASGSFTTSTNTGSTLSGDAFEIRASGGRLTIARGRGPSLTPVLSIDPATERLDVTTEQQISVPFALSHAARVAVEVARDGTVVHRVEETSFESGEGAVAVDLIDDSGAPLGAGEYTVTLVAYDGLDRIRSTPVAVVVAAPTPTSTPTPVSPSGTSGLALGGGALLAAAAGSFLVFRRRPRADA